MEPDGDEADGTGSEDEPCTLFMTANRGPACVVSDPDASPNDRNFVDYGVDQSTGPLPLKDAEDAAIGREHRDRIRRTRCESIAVATCGRIRSSPTTG